MKRKKLEESGMQALMLIRKAKLEKGLPFMINSSKLPSDQCYFEYPDGTIWLATINRSKDDFDLTRLLSAHEQVSLRKMLQIA